jgi:hypothetical protein
LRLLGLRLFSLLAVRRIRRFVRQLERDVLRAVRNLALFVAGLVPAFFLGF